MCGGTSQNAEEERGKEKEDGRQDRVGEILWCGLLLKLLCCCCSSTLRKWWWCRTYLDESCSTTRGWTAQNAENTMRIEEGCRQDHVRAILWCCCCCCCCSSSSSCSCSCSLRWWLRCYCDTSADVIVIWSLFKGNFWLRSGPYLRAISFWKLRTDENAKKNWTIVVSMMVGLVLDMYRK
jgi:hypothetical protein